MKSRKPLKPGDRVKFVGWAASRYHSDKIYDNGGYYYDVNSISDYLVKIICSGKEYLINRRQVVAVKRKVKKELRRIWVKETDLARGSICTTAWPQYAAHQYAASAPVGYVEFVEVRKNEKKKKA